MTVKEHDSRPLVAVIDDEEDITAFLALVLADAGYRVVTCNQPAEALALLRREPPDLICLDLVMPGKTGGSLYVALRRDPLLSATPVLILSGLGARDEVLQTHRRRELRAAAGGVSGQAAGCRRADRADPGHRAVPRRRRRRGGAMSGRPRWPTIRRGQLFDEVPCGIAVLDPELHVVDQNSAFTAIFGEGNGRTCHALCRGSDRPCSECPVGLCFADGRERTVEETARDRHGNSIQYLARLQPVRNGQGRVTHVATIHTDLTAARQLQREHQALFDRVPCYVAVLNRDLRVVKANHEFRRAFGEPRGETCHALIKQSHVRCAECPTLATFADGTPQTRHHIGRARDGTPTHMLVSTAPLRRGDGTISHVIEMCLDITHSHQLEEELRRAHTLRHALVASALDAIVVLDAEEKIVLINQAAEELWGLEPGAWVGRRLGRKRLPLRLGALLYGGQERLVEPGIEVASAGGEPTPVRLTAVTLRQVDSRGDHAEVLGVAVFAQDLREVKRLEREKLEAERLAAVGQTVAGLSHGIKNIMTGLEGGRYIMRTGLKQSDTKRIQLGWGMLERNINRIGTMARSLLTFSRGEEPRARLVDPAQPAREVVELYVETARQHGVELQLEAASDLALASLDPDGIHDALANLVSNAVDACLVSNESARRVIVTVGDDADRLIYTVSDTGCGMDYQIKQKVFTSFFTTKGRGGTGIGLLTTRKIVQQHGGRIDFESAPGQGTTFRLEFRRERLPEPLAVSDTASEPEPSAAKPSATKPSATKPDETEPGDSDPTRS